MDEITVEYPVGHARRRREGIPLLVEKFKINLARIFSESQQKQIWDASTDYKKLIAMPVNEYLDLYVNSNYKNNNSI
jgi:2-methylcitrate dehydratase